MWQVYVVDDNGNVERIECGPLSGEEVGVFLENLTCNVKSLLLFPGSGEAFSSLSDHVEPCRPPAGFRVRGDLSAED